MKIAYIGNNQLGSFRRARAYAKNYPQYTHHFFKIREHFSEQKISHPKSDEGLEFFEFEESLALQKDYDIVLNMNDKYFHYVLQYNNFDGKNLIKKDQLYLAAKKIIFGNIKLPKCENFNDDDIVFIKPTYSSGCYDQLNYGYRQYTFKDIKTTFKNNPLYLTQEFIDTSDAVILYFISNGEGDVRCVDVVEQEYVNINGVPTTVFNETNLISKEIYSNLKQFCLNLIESEKYNFIKSFYSIQFLVKNDEFYLIDFNSRIGPATLEVEMSGKLSGKLFNYLDFMMGKIKFEDAQIPKNNGFVHYSIDRATGHALSRRPIKRHPSDIIFSSDQKNTGLVNSFTTAFAKIK